MRVVRFTPSPDAGLGNDPLFGILEDDDQITIISGDPIYHGIQKTAARVDVARVTNFASSGLFMLINLLIQPLNNN